MKKFQTFYLCNQEELAKVGRLVELVSTVKEDKEQKYNLYHNFRQDLSRINSYQYLAISRGEKEKILKVSFAFKGSSKTSSKCDDGISDIEI